MQLQISGLSPDSNPFAWIWGRYVFGFNGTEHCQKCLKTKSSHPDITSFSSSVPIDLREDADYFYICAGGRPLSALANVHLVVKPQAGAVASAGSLYGVTFTIQDALAIRIRTLPLGWRGLDKGFTQCPNFQFGVQAYGYPARVDLVDRGPLVSTPDGRRL